MAENGTFIGRPITSRDGADDSGVRAEVLVQKGLATIEKKEEKKSKDQVRFVFISENLKDYGIGAWVNRAQDQEIYDLLSEAYDEETPIYIRTEKRRKASVDRKTPIADIIKEDKASEKVVSRTVNIVAGVKTEEDAEWIESSEAITLTSEDGSTGSVKATPSNTIRVKQTNPFDANVEAPPYKTTNPDGSVNPGSSSVAAVMNTYNFVYEYTRKPENNVALPENEKEAQKLLIDVTKKVLTTVNKAQIKIYDGKMTRPNMSAGSHVRARALVFHTIENVNKLSQEHLDDKEALTTYLDEVLERVVRMWNWGITTVGKIEGIDTEG